VFVDDEFLREALRRLRREPTVVAFNDFELPPRDRITVFLNERGDRGIGGVTLFGEEVRERRYEADPKRRLVRARATRQGERRSQLASPWTNTSFGGGQRDPYPAK
jgi:hypothetical protein